MAKKTKKVIRKKVKSKKKVVRKKKKTVKKKVLKKKKTVKRVLKKKKTVKKKVFKKNKKVVKRKKRRKRKKKATMDDIYKIINKVQLGSKSITFVVTNIEAEMIENVVKDAIAKYHRVSMKTQTVFTLYPEDREKTFEILEIEQLDDEIVEEGQIFP